MLQFPASSANQLEMLRRIDTDAEEKKALIEQGERKNITIKQNESKITSLREEIQNKYDQKNVEIDELN